MKALTVRGIDEPLSNALRHESERRGISMNALALDLLRRGLGIGRQTQPVHHDLDFLFGTWTKEEAEEFDKVVEEEFEQIDWDDWK